MSCFLYLSDDICGIGTKYAAHFEVTSNRKQKIIFVRVAKTESRKLYL